jgi:hypothetical protein
MRGEAWESQFCEGQMSKKQITWANTKKWAVENKALAALIIIYIPVQIIVAILLNISASNSTTSNIIVAWATITLVFVTIFYAIQTQRLAEQEKQNLIEHIRKRNADFGERRIREFYFPFNKELKVLMRLLSNPAAPFVDIKRVIKIVKDHFYSTGYLIEEDQQVLIELTFEKMDELLLTKMEPEKFNKLRLEVTYHIERIVAFGSGRVEALRTELLKVYGGLFGSPNAYVMGPNKHDIEEMGEAMEWTKKND